MVHTYNGILLSYKKEWIWVSSSEVDEPRACYTEWVSQKEKNKYCILTHIWNLGRRYWWSYLWDSSRDTDIQNRLVDTVGEGEGGTNGENSIETYTLPCVKQIASGNLLYDGALWQPREVGSGGEWEGGSRGRGHMYTYGWFMLMYGRNQYNSVKQLSSN